MFDTEPIQGRLFDQQNDRGLDRPFSGWLGLMSAIDAARGGHPPSQQKGET
jgi:hypothetical protein